MEETKIFKILKYAAEHEVFTGAELCSETGFKWHEVRDYAERIWPAVASNQQQPFGVFQREGIFEHESGNPLPGTTNVPEEDQRRYRITYTAMMHWLDYIELKDARRASLRAQRNASISISIAIAAIAISSGLVLVQIAGSVVLAVIQIVSAIAGV